MLFNQLMKSLNDHAVIYKALKFKSFHNGIIGSKKAIEIAKKNVPAALNKLNDCIACIQLLDSNAIQHFADQSEKIFKIIGPEAAKFADEKEALDAKIRQNRINQQNLVSALGKKRGKCYYTERSFVINR